MTSTTARLLCGLVLSTAGCHRTHMRLFSHSTSDLNTQSHDPAWHAITIDGRRIGQARVPMGEVVRPTMHEPALVRVDVRLQNTHADLLSLTFARLDVRAKTLLLGLAPHKVVGRTIVASGDARAVFLYFALPQDVHVEDVRRFVLTWAVNTKAGQMRARTLFERTSNTFRHESGVSGIERDFATPHTGHRINRAPPPPKPGPKF